MQPHRKLKSFPREELSTFEHLSFIYPPTSGLIETPLEGDLPWIVIGTSARPRVTRSIDSSSYRSTGQRGKVFEGLQKRRRRREKLLVSLVRESSIAGLKSLIGWQKWWQNCRGPSRAKSRGGRERRVERMSTTAAQCSSGGNIGNKKENTGCTGGSNSSCN